MSQKLFMIIKPDKKNIVPDALDIEDDFFNHSHMQIDEYTLCGVACDEWDYDKYTLEKKITCPACLQIIKICKSYKL